MLTTSNNPIVSPPVLPVAAWGPPIAGLDGLTDSQRRMMTAVMAGRNVYCSGIGGTGKTYMINRVQALAASIGLNVAVCAPTGMAAFLIDGMTLHRVFRAEAGIIPPTEAKAIPYLMDKDVVIIDEVSMCRRDLFEYAIRCIRKTEAECAKDNQKLKPGGPTYRWTQLHKQVLLFGDFGQLAPVLKANEAAAYRGLFPSGGLFPFCSPLWSEMGLARADLVEVVRQQDRAFIERLRLIRLGKVSPLSSFLQGQPASPNAVTLCTRNETADKINNSHIKMLAGGRRYDVFVKGNVAQDEMVAERVLHLAPGARVIFINNDKDNRWQNGAAGTVLECREDSIVVRKDGGGDVDVERYRWAIRQPTVQHTLSHFGATPTVIDEVGLAVVAEYSQFPLRLGWAITVHKAQGQTFNEVNIANGRFFADGQLYVALSRCRSEQGLHIMGRLTESDLHVNADFLSFENGTFLLQNLPIPDISQNYLNFA